MLSLILASTADDGEAPSLSVLGERSPPVGGDEVDLRVEGRVEGNIRTNGRVSVAPGARVSGTISARIIRVAGAVEGTIQAEEKLTLLPSAEIHATLDAPTLHIHAGFRFDGTIHEGRVDRPASSPAGSPDPRAESEPPRLAPLPPGQTPEDLSCLDAPRPLLGTASAANRTRSMPRGRISRNGEPSVGEHS